MFDSVRGLYCTLRRPDIEDLAIMTAWMKDPHLNESVFDQTAFSGGAKKQARAWIQSNTEVYGSDVLVLIADNLKNSEPIGLVIFSNIDWRSRTAEIRYLIGEQQQRNSLFGPEMTFLGLLLVFNTLNFHKIYGNVAETNADSVSLASFGGRTEGKLESYIRYEDETFNYLLMGIFASEFREFVQANKERLLRRHFRAGLLP